MELPFDIYAMVKPKTAADYILVLEEALAEAKHLNELLDANYKELEAKFNKEK